MQGSKRNTDVKKRLLDNMGEGEGGRIERMVMKPVYYHM